MSKAIEWHEGEAVYSIPYAKADYEQRDLLRRSPHGFIDPASTRKIWPRRPAGEKWAAIIDADATHAACGNPPPSVWQPRLEPRMAEHLPPAPHEPTEEGLEALARLIAQARDLAARPFDPLGWARRIVRAADSGRVAEWEYSVKAARRALAEPAPPTRDMGSWRRLI